jgi:hypothetical protein
MSLRGRERNPLGGDSLSGKATVIEGVDWITSQGNVRGVYGLYPAMTPKYHTGSSVAGAADKSLEKMARMFIAFPPNTTALREKFINSVGGQAQRFAKAMASTGQPGAGLGYIDFLLTQATEQFAENFQVVQVLSDNYVSYFFGQAPPVFKYDGVLLNSVQDDWRIAMWLIYHNIIRGTQLARRKVAVSLAYDSVVVTGAITNMTEILRSDNELAVPFSFNLLVKRFDIVKLPQFGPTPAQSFPYKLMSDTFASTVVEPAQVSRRAVGDPAMKIQERQGASDEEEGTQPFFGNDTYNDVSAAMRAQAEAIQKGIAPGVFGNKAVADIALVAARLAGGAS